ncbi:hypothetical protein BPAE_0457g00010 [Botrytis paeoniae]|uniref:Uncharacterized protein n=1 Tax=Botrytis paeoniae TaxID=278948 RepID=A0A4Z1F692_9HELO|nr:hypothetical protein BPAE_0457g00010 [Botrytis paeoniae]
MSPPYPPRSAIIGLTPTHRIDTPLTTIFMLLFLLSSIIHMSLLQINFRRGQKFLMSGMAFGFSFSRVITCALRIIWASYPSNIRLALAAQVFVAAGTILLYLIDIIFASRLLRTFHTWAWKHSVRTCFRVGYVSLFAGLITNISVLVENFFTLDPHVLWIDRIVILVVSIYFAFFAFVPIPLLALRLLLPRHQAEKFGTGKLRTKVRLVLVTSVLLTLGAAFKAGTAYLPRGIDDPAWYHSKACFYIFDFGIEIVVLFLFAIMRVDRRFIVPNQTKMQGDFRKGGPGGMPVKGEEGAREVRWEWMRGFKGEWREWSVEGDDEIFSRSNIKVGDGEADAETAVGSNASGEVTPEAVGSRETVDINVEKGNK